MFYSARSLYCWSLRRAGPLICVQRSGQSGQWSWLPGSSSGSGCEEGRGGEARQVQWGVRSWEHGTSHNLTLRLRLLGGLDTVDTGLSGHHLKPEPEPELIMNHWSQSELDRSAASTSDKGCQLSCEWKKLEFYQIVLISPSLSKLISSENVWSLPYFWRPFWKKNNFVMLLQD